MAKYLVQARYTAPAGVKGLLEDGGTERVKAVKGLMQSLGGTVESFYFTNGGVEVYLVIDMADSASAAAAALTVSATGLVTIEEVIELITPEEMDAAVKKSPFYDAPGKADNK